MSRLPQLRSSLVSAAERRAEKSLPAADTSPPTKRALPRRRSARRGSAVLLIAVGLLALTAVAYATSRLIQTGAAVKPEERFSPSAGAGVAIPKTEDLLGIAAPDPAGGPPWTMRAYDTSRGLGCVQVGRLVGGRIGVLGQDGAFNDDARFHPLPPQTSQNEGDCVLLDGRGHAFLGVGVYGEPASGLLDECHLLHPRAKAERCAKSDPRDVFYGLLGPDARSITYTLDGYTRTSPTVGSDGAYLIVEPTPPNLLTLPVEATSGSGVLPAGGGSVDGRRLPQPIHKITYTGRRTCTIGSPRNEDNHGGHCLPPAGYATVRLNVPSARKMASPIHVRRIFGQPVWGHPGVHKAALLISFVAHVAVTSALTGYTVGLLAPDSGRCRAPSRGAAYESLSRNVRAGERIQVKLLSGAGNSVSLFPGCPGVAHGSIVYNVPSEELVTGGSYGPFARRHARRVTVGTFTYRNPG
jgi:hypothetical protein